VPSGRPLGKPCVETVCAATAECLPAAAFEQRCLRRPQVLCAALRWSASCELAEQAGWDSRRCSAGRPAACTSPGSPWNQRSQRALTARAATCVGLRLRQSMDECAVCDSTRPRRQDPVVTLCEHGPFCGACIRGQLWGQVRRHARCSSVCAQMQQPANLPCAPDVKPFCDAVTQPTQPTSCHIRRRPGRSLRARRAGRRLPVPAVPRGPDARGAVRRGRAARRARRGAALSRLPRAHAHEPQVRGDAGDAELGHQVRHGVGGSCGWRC